MANALKKHKSPKARLVLHCSCIVAANINQSFWTCEVAHCPWSSVTEPRPTFDMVWIIAPAWKCLVFFLKQLYSPLNCLNKRDTLNRTSSSVRHWMLWPWFCKHRCPCSSAPLRWFQEAPQNSPPPCLTSPSPPLHWVKSLSTGPVFLTSFPLSFPCLTSFLCNLHPRLLCGREQDLLLPTEAREGYLQIQRAQECPSPPCSSPVTEHRALGALPWYWLSPAAPGRKTKSSPGLSLLRPVNTETLEELFLPPWWSVWSTQCQWIPYCLLTGSVEPRASIRATGSDQSSSQLTHTRFIHVSVLFLHGITALKS